MIANLTLLALCLVSKYLPGYDNIVFHLNDKGRAVASHEQVEFLTSLRPGYLYVEARQYLVWLVLEVAVLVIVELQLYALLTISRLLLAKRTGLL